MAKMMRITDISNESLDYLAKTTGETKQQLIEDAIELLIRKNFFEQTAKEAADLQKDPRAWAEYQSELKEWDVTLSDGLEDEDLDSLIPKKEKGK